MIAHCRMVMCPNATALGSRFCSAHEIEFAASPEGHGLGHAARSDFRDRVWKERCKLDEEKKRAQAEHDAKAAKA